MPLLDIYTLIVAYVVGNLLVGSLMLAAFNGRLTPVLRTWIASLFVQSLGWVLMTQCGGARPMLGFAVLSVSYGLMLTALTLHFGVSRRWHWPWWPVMLACVFCLTAPDSFWYRQVIGNLIAALQILLAALVMLSQKGQRPALRWLMGASGVVGAAMLAVRAVDVFQAGEAQCMAHVRNAQMSLMFLSFFIFRFTFMFGFILLIEGRQREAVTRLARLDSLTEAYNRRTFIELAERELGRCRRHGRSISLLIFDLDYFKRINDTHGHMAGDEVLCRVKEVVEDCLRSADLLARYGGEEFVVLMPETDPAGALRLAERLRLAIAAIPMQGDMPVTASLGVAGTTKVDEACTLDGLLDEADKALYAAKAAGRNRVAGAAMTEAAGLAPAAS
ncbi:MAG TPA: GGDEF domain-containing protein [Rhodocyclaceae bacterium]|nr:GGDEF domain-containing protein [Rhodocyclaceae bacterium]